MSTVHILYTYTPHLFKTMTILKVGSIFVLSVYIISASGIQIAQK